MSNSRLVYSTDSGRVTAAHETAEAPEKGGDATLIISRQTKGRKGKGVTLIDGFQLPPAELKQLAKTLKQRCSTGGTIKDSCIEIQGDHREELASMLKQLGFTTKRSGG
jgi:translation initiation factor 1